MIRIQTEIAAPSGQSNAARKGSVRRWRSWCRKRPQQERCKKIAQRKNEGKSCAGEQAGNGERQDDAQKCLKRTGAEVVRGFDKRARNVLECRVMGRKTKGV